MWDASVGVLCACALYTGSSVDARRRITKTTLMSITKDATCFLSITDTYAHGNR
jgi:hypothetical protein